MTKIIGQATASNYLDNPERSHKALFLLADDGFIYSLNSVNQSFTINQFQPLREGVTFQELLNWEQYLHTGCWIETRSGGEKKFRSELKSIAAIEEDKACWTPVKYYYFGEERRMDQYSARIAMDYLPSMLRWALNKAKQNGEDESWVLKRGAVNSMKQPWKNKECIVLPFIARDVIAKKFADRINLQKDDGPPSPSEAPRKEDQNEKKEPDNKEYAIIKSVSGTLFWEGGCGTGQNSGMRNPSGIPRWFCDLRGQGKIRVNSMSYSHHWLRSDGSFYHITGCCLHPRPLRDAFSGDPSKLADFLDNVYTKGGVPSHSAKFEIWECGEYIADDNCDDLSNFWKVAAAARRTGRFLYTSKKKHLKELLEGPQDSVPWIYAPTFDQFTQEYETRYRRRIESFAKEKEEREKRGTKRIHFDYDIKDLYGKNDVNHWQVLQISPGAGPRKIKAAYWEMAKQCHPDLHPGSKDAEERFKQLSISYQALIRLY